MARTKQYKSETDVVMALAEGKDRKLLMQIKYRNKGTDYADMIQRGIDQYDRLTQLQRLKGTHVLPEDYLTSDEMREYVGWKGTEDNSNNK